MDDAEFDALVRRLEPQAQRDWGSYRTRVALLGALGYAYMGVVLLALLGIAGALIAVVVMAKSGAGAIIKIVIIPLAATGYILKALWVKIPAPEGRRVTRKEAPRLFEEAEAIAAQLQAPRPDVVLITLDYNASVAQVPRLGVFGFPRNYLSVGLPLLAMLPPDHVRAVLAHEFAHLSHAHGKVGVWCYRVRATWTQLMQRLQQDQHWSAWIFRRFFQWYVPYFTAYTFVLMRRHEFEADALAADVVGTDSMAQTLVDLEVRGSRLAASFWPGVWKSAEDTADVPPGIYSRLAATASEAVESESVAAQYSLALQRKTDTGDTHPSLHDRISHLKRDGAGDVRPALQFTGNAVDAYLAPSHDAILAELSEAWRVLAAESWRIAHEAHRAAIEGLAQLEARDPATLTLDERFRFASWVEDIRGAESALPLLRAINESNPEFVPAAYFIGRILSARGDEGGLRFLEQAMASDEEAIIPGCQLIISFLEARGRLDEAAVYRAKLNQRAMMLGAARDERAQITKKDKFHLSNYPREQLEAVLQALDSIPETRRAWLVQKEVQHLAVEAPMHVLVVQLAWSSVKFVSDHKKELRRQEVERNLAIPDGLSLFVLTDKHYPISDRVKKVAGAKIYDSGDRKAQRKVASASAAPGPGS